MKSIETVFLSMKDVAAVGLTMQEVIAVVEDAFGEHGHKQVENPPKPGIHPQEDTFIHAMPGYLVRKKAAGMKWISGFSANLQLGLPAVMGLIILNDVETGQPLAVMDGTYITALRTAAVSAVSAKYLARAGAAAVGIVGTGVQGRYHLLALKEILPDIKTVKVYDIHRPTVDRLLGHFKNRLPFHLQAADNIEEVITGAEVIVTATGNLTEIIYKKDWIRPGALVLPVHTRGWEPDFLEQADKLVVDDWEQIRTYFKLAGSPYAPLPEPYAEIGEIVIGKKNGREKPAERIVNFNLGLAIHDVALAQIVFKRATAGGLGVRLSLIDRELPFSLSPILFPVD